MQSKFKICQLNDVMIAVTFSFLGDEDSDGGVVVLLLLLFMLN